MGKKTNTISSKLQDFIKNQKIFFVGTAAAEGRINISPKGCDSLKVLDATTVLWLNLTGSGNETAAHLLKDERMTIMFCSFDKNPLILRLYGQAKIYHRHEAQYAEYINLFPDYAGARQLIKLQVDLVQTSCGFGVPFMEFIEERETLNDWAEELGDQKIKEYWKAKNVKSIDGFETGILKSNP